MQSFPQTLFVMSNGADARKMPKNPFTAAKKTLTSSDAKMRQM